MWPCAKYSVDDALAVLDTVVGKSLEFRVPLSIASLGLQRLSIVSNTGPCSKHCEPKELKNPTWHYVRVYTLARQVLLDKGDISTFCVV